jgi:arabinose-5-phosphate isomerase
MTATPATAGPKSQDVVERGRAVIRKERDALERVEARIGGEFARAVALIATARPGARVIVAGVGKSGHVARKLAATLTSTGTPATFLHPVDSVHGDLGLVGRNDIAVLISKSGESAEVLGLLEHVQRFGVRTIAIAGAPGSTLARHCDVTLDASVEEEACPHDLAPTSSTTAAFALGDALAVALLHEKGFRREDFARLHPGGALGRQLLTRVADVMLREGLPVLPRTATMREAVVQLAERRGIVMVTDANGALAGVITAGDLTRLMEREREFFEMPVDAVMTARPRTARRDELGSAAVYRMEHHGIMALPVVDADRRVEGVVHLHDLLRAGVA